MHLTRKLLDHRGVDDELATYVTDYVLSVICWILGSHLLYLKLKPSATAPKVEYMLREERINEKSYKTSVVILIMYTFCSVSLLAGLVHQFLQTVENYTTWTDDWRWLVVWRFASAISCALDGGFIMLGLQILAEEKVFAPSRKQFLVGYSLLAFLIGAKFVYSLAKLSHPYDPWSLRDDFLISFICVLVGLIMVIVACCSRKTPQVPSVTSSATNEVTLTLDSVEVTPAENSSTSSYVVEHRSTRRRCRVDLLLTLLGYITFFASGVAYFIFSDMCSDKKAIEEQNCPFPKSFNKNAWFHVFLVPVFVLFYFAELLSIRRKAAKV